MLPTILSLFSPDLLKTEWSLIKLALPVTFLYILRSSTSSVTFYFAGQLGKSYLDGVGLSNTMYGTVVFAFTIGYANVFDTYGPQVYGSSRHRKELSTVALKCVAQGTIIFLFILGPYLNLVYLIEALPDDESDVTGKGYEFKDVAKQYLRMTAICSYLSYLIKIMSNYLAIQKQTKFVYVIAVVIISSHIALNYVFVAKLSLGTTGLALATITSLVITFILTFTICFVMIKRGKLVWGGVTGKIFDNWVPMLKLGLSGVASIMAEIGVFEGAVFLSQFDSSTVLSTFLIQYRALVFCFAISIGLSYASAVNMGKALSQGNLNEVKLTMALAVCNVITEAVILSLIAYSIRRPLALLFTAEEDVIAMTGSSMWMFCLLTPIDHMQCVLGRGILVTFGKQRFIALVMGILAVFVAMPIVALSVFLTDLHIGGIYLSYLVFCSLLVALFVIRIWKLDFDEEIKKATERVNQSSVENYSERKATNGTVNKAYEAAPDETVMKEISEERDVEVTRRFSISKPRYNRARDTKVILLAFFGSVVSCTVFGIISIINN